MIKKDISYRKYGVHNGYPIFYLHGWISSSFEASLLHDDAVNEKVFIIAIDRMRTMVR